MANKTVYRRNSNWRMFLAATLMGAAVVSARAATPATINVDVNKPGIEIPPNFSGLMTEEINHAYDGGLYAELIQNRTFQDRETGADKAPIHWSVIGSGATALNNVDPVNAALPISLHLDLTGGLAGIANDGYWGIPVRPDTTYTATFYAKGGGGFAGPVTASIVMDDGNVAVAQQATDSITDKWQKYTVKFTTGHDAPTTAKAKFALTATGTGEVSFSFVSLFPPTYQDTPNGLRPDLMKLMADLRPKFIRLPGGNYVEGGRFSDRFNWKKMIGPADQRPGHMGCWSYRSSDGFGLPEYLLWCRQLGAEPVLAVFAGYTLNGDHVNAGDPEMAIYTEEALQEIEYVSGSADSEWGKKRVADGLAEPFKLHYVEIGNEDFFDKSGSYDGRFTQMAKAVRERYPDLKIIATAPVKSLRPDLYDDHYYDNPRTMANRAHMYDKPTDSAFAFPGMEVGSRRLADGTKIFVGEWAAQDGRPTPTLAAALGDAAFVMGLEGNSDVVSMQCYAPLFANANLADREKGYPRGWQWETNLLGYDALHSYGSPSYYAQVMLAKNKGDVVLPATLEMDNGKTASDPVVTGPIGVGTWHTQVEYKDITVTSPTGQSLYSADLSKELSGWQFTGGEWRTQDQAMRNVDPGGQAWAIVGDPHWTDYTINLKARKLGGEEGFVILFHAPDGENYSWWNVGGWGNTTTRCESAESGDRDGYGPGTPFRVEQGRWYDLKIEVAGPHMKGYIDGQLVTEATQPPRPAKVSVYTSATFSKADHTVIVKVVNSGPSAVDGTVKLAGVDQVDPKGTAIVLTGEPKAVNSLENPVKVVPAEEQINVPGTSFPRTFAPYSLTILRLKTQ